MLGEGTKHKKNNKKKHRKRRKLKYGKGLVKVRLL